MEDKLGKTYQEVDPCDVTKKENAEGKMADSGILKNIINQPTLDIIFGLAGGNHYQTPAQKVNRNPNSKKIKTVLRLC